VFIILRMLEPADLKALPERNRDGTPEPPGARAIRAGLCLGLGERGLRNRECWQEFYCPLRRGSVGGRGGRAHSLEEWIDVETETSFGRMRASLATILAIAEMDMADEPPAGRET
jgi:hypothetical protein